MDRDRLFSFEALNLVKEKDLQNNDCIQYDYYIIKSISLMVAESCQSRECIKYLLISFTKLNPIILSMNFCFLK